MKRFVISDTHFGHENIIKLANRPFKNVDEMDNALIKNWNSVVSKDDYVLFGGDFSWYKDIDINRVIFESLNGHKFLIKGNHDPKTTTALDWLAIKEMFELSEYNMVICHYPLQDWNNKFHGSIHLHGHVHGNPEFSGMKNRWDISVEAPWMNYTPKEINWFIERREKHGK